MYRFVILNLIIISFLSINAQNRNPDYELYFKKGETRKLFDNRYLLITYGTLVNNTNDTLSYRSKTCSWQDYYITNNTYAKIEKPECDKNIEFMEKIPPKGSKSIELKIIFDTCREWVNFKIALNLIRIDSFMIDKTEDLTNLYKTIWSNKLKFKKASR
jgi:hypothetical protein